jgi:hypothetical protein
MDEAESAFAFLPETFLSRRKTGYPARRMQPPTRSDSGCVTMILQVIKRRKSTKKPGRNG